jgi:hypothetical protein
MNEIRHHNGVYDHYLADYNQDHDNHESTLRVSVYSQTIPRNVGRVQADVIRHALRNTRGSINMNITSDDGRDDRDDEDEVFIDPGVQLVSGKSFQMYNQMAHRVRMTPIPNDVGTITAALTGG